MKKLLIICATATAMWSLLMLDGRPAHAVPRVVVGKPKIVTRTVTGLLAPPPKYDKPYEGELEIVFFQIKKTWTRLVSSRRGVHACASRTPDGKKCFIFASSEEFIKRKDRNYAFMLHHELAHCNGWRHPEDTNGKRFTIGDTWKEAEGAKWVVASTKASMPKLPASTRALPASSPVVCVTPEWKPEPCNDRATKDVWATARPLQKKDLRQ